MRLSIILLLTIWLISYSAYLDHGPLPKDASLTYAVLPAADLDKTRRFSENPDVKVLSQTASLHAACHHPSKV